MLQKLLMVIIKQRKILHRNFTIKFGIENILYSKNVQTDLIYKKWVLFIKQIEIDCYKPSFFGFHSSQVVSYAYHFWLILSGCQDS